MKRTVKILVIAVLSAYFLTGCSKISIDFNRNEAESTDANTVEYILPSDKENITELQLSRLNETELKYAYEEIYARYGKIFEDENYSRYFNGQDWYKPNPSFNEADVSSLEKVNAQTIKKYIKEHYETTTQTTTQAVTAAPKVPEKPKTNNTNVYVDMGAFQQFINNYCYNMCSAINNGDYSIVSPYIANGSALEADQRKLVSNLYSKGTTESFVSATVNRLEPISGNTYLAYVTETETIYYASGKVDTKTFNWKYTARLNNGVWELSNIAR